MAVQKWFLHADLDAFFASVEQLDHPEYRGKPVIVGGLPTDQRSVVSTASYEARKFGVHSAMPTKEAYRLCPHGIYVHGDHRRYAELSWQIMEIFRRFSPDVQQMSIDEAFIDLTGTERLFGPPEETAMKIKKAVKDEIGLTVSIGLAQTKYFAKLSSEINKPDGFYFMKPGTETEYMLSIPIEKIWGIGKKTAARIKDSGIKTTKQLYETPLNTLSFMYGNNTAQFLYDILRGKCEGMFDAESKTHSISNERTFPFDVTDYYANETALLELAHSVMFRLLRENLRSRTIVIKIRYDDFSTVSIRQTFETDIITLDTFFEKVRELFNRKYERGRGVRLLGVGFDNVTTEPSTYQQELFDDGQKKKQAVEKAILKFEKKYPDLPVKKARLIDPKNKTLLCILLTSLLFSFITPEAKADTPKTLGINSEKELLPLPQEAPEHLFDLDINDSSVEVFSSGYWKAEAGTSLYTGISNKGFNGFGSGGFVFKQEINLDFKILVDKTWFFETAFADEFKKNTITFGYENTKDSDTYVRKAVLSNRNILYPEHYSSFVNGFNPGGGSSQNPGFYINMEGENWKSDLMFRYDLVHTNSAVFYGMNEVSDFVLPITNFQNNKFYYVPENFFSQIEYIYIESDNGSYKDSSGNFFTKLSTEDYFFYKEGNLSLLVLTRNISSSFSSEKKYEPRILLSFKNAGNLESFLSNIGTPDDPTSFFGLIQDLFLRSGHNLKNLGFLKKDKLSETIDSKQVLILQDHHFFSPFKCMSLYDAGISLSSNLPDFFVHNISNDNESENYSTEKMDFISSSLSGFSEINDRNYIRIYNSSINNNESVPLAMFPFADLYGDIYLFGETVSSKPDQNIISRNYIPSQAIQISTSQNPQMVTVYINGIQDTAARFDKSTGIITPSKEISETDKIYITWQEENSGYKNGAVSAGAGFQTDINKNFSFDVDLTAFWPLSPSLKYSTAQDIQNGYVSLNQGTYFKTDRENFKIQNIIGAALTANDVTGKKLVYETCSELPETFYQKSTSAHISNEKPNIPVLYGAYSGICENIIPIRDKDISGYGLPLVTNFKPENEKTLLPGEQIYVSMNISLPDFSNGTTFSIALKPEWKNQAPENLSDYNVFLQLGINAEDETKSKTLELPYWKLTDNSQISENLDLSNNQWQIISVNLSEEDRVKLSGYHDARIIAVKKIKEDVSDFNPVFSLTAGPYECSGTEVKLSSSENLMVYSEIKMDNTTPLRKDLGISENFITHIYWKENSVQSNVPYVSFYDYFTETDFTKYKKIQFCFKKEKLELKGTDAFINFVISGQNSEAVNLYISKAIIEGLSDDWHIISADLHTKSEKCIYIDGTKIQYSKDSNEFLLNVNENSLPNKISVIINGYESGHFYMDKVLFTETMESWKLQENLQFTYDSSYISLLSKSKYEADLGENISHIISTYGEASFHNSFTEVKSDVNVSSAGKQVLNNAGHSLKINNIPVTPLKFISFSETYRYTPDQKTSDKTDSLALNFSPYKLPLSLNFWTRQKTENFHLSDEDKAGLSYGGKYAGGSISAEFKNNRNISTLEREKLFNSNYFIQYGNLWTDFVSFGKDSKSDGQVNSLPFIRNEKYLATLYGNTTISGWKPKLSFELSSEYTKTPEEKLHDYEIFMWQNPFSFNTHNFNISYTRKSSGLSYITGSDYFSDTEKLFSIQKDRDLFYKAVPLYDLFDKKLFSLLSKSDSSNENTYYSEYSTTWERQLFHNSFDFIIPSGFSFSIFRNLQYSASLTDTRNYKLETTCQAFNIFGKESNLKLFSWYEDDEFLNSFKLQIYHPSDSPEKLSYAVSYYGQAFMYIDNNNSLKTAADITVNKDSSNNLTLWDCTGSAVYSWKGEKSLIASFIQIFIPEENKADFSILRKESLNGTFGVSEAGNFQTIVIAHNCDVNFKKYYSVYSDTALSYTHKKSQGHTLAIDLTIGGKVTF